MTEWSKDHVAAIGFLNLNFETFCRSWLNWKVKTIDWEGRGVVSGKPSPSRL
jgi:hypothetical protein